MIRLLRGGRSGGLSTALAEEGLVLLLGLDEGLLEEVRVCEGSANLA